MALHRTVLCYGTSEGDFTVKVLGIDRINTMNALDAEGALENLSVLEYRYRLAYTAATRLGLTSDDYQEWLTAIETDLEEAEDAGEAAAAPAS